VFGVSVAVVTVRALVSASPVPLPRVESIGVDVRLLSFAAAIAAATTIASGVVPALLMARGDIQRPLKESGRGGDTSRRRARSLLVIAEVGLAVMLLVGATLLGRSFRHLVAEDPGFQTARTVTARVELPYSYSDWPRIVAFYDRLLAGVQSQPGVVLAGAANFLPLEAAWRGPYFIYGRPRPRAGDENQAQHQTIDERYFRVLGVPLIKGRYFDERDTADAPGVVIVNDVLARRQWPDDDPLGQTLTSPIRFIGPMGRSLMKDTSFQVVGVVASIKNASLDRDAEPALYFTYRQFPFRGLNVVVRGRGDPPALVGAVRSAVEQLDPNLPISQARTLDRVVADATDRPRALMLLMAMFAALALVLAALGIYSVLSYGVSQRQQELSVRIALGAQPRDVLRLVIGQGLGLAALGALIGAAGALALGRTMSSLLYGVSPADATSFSVAIGLATLTALVACYVPARRAALIDPLDGLRSQ
jgi:putative ABC transport system permease protein